MARAASVAGKRKTAAALQRPVQNLTGDVMLEELALLNPSEPLAKDAAVPFLAMTAIHEGARAHDAPVVGKKRTATRFRDSDTLFARITPCLQNGKIAQVSGLGDGVVGSGSTELVVLRAKPGVATPSFIFYTALSPQFRAYAERGMSGATGRQRVDSDYLGRFPAALPPLETQRKIAAVLSAYDDLIENNNRRIQVLEEMAQRIYREWFVHFRYPGHEDVPMVESEIGPIPEGWEVATISAAVGHKRNSVTPQDFPSEDFRLLSIPAFDQGQRPEIVAGEEIQSGKFLLDRSSVLYSKLNPQTPRVWIAEVGGAMRTVVSSEFLVLEPIPPWTTTTAFLLLAQRKIARQVAACANGTSTSHQRIRPADLLSIQIPVPPRALLLQMDELTAPVVNLSTSLATQETLLRSTRDLLLPRLVSGELDVSDLDIQVPEAA